MASLPSYSTIAIETPATVQGAKYDGAEETRSECEQSFSTTMSAGGLLALAESYSTVVSDTGAAANSVGLRL